MKLHRYNTIKERFWDRINKTPTCWLWTGATSCGRYGSLRVSGKTVKAHRFMWESVRGPVPEGMFVCHMCDNGLCVRPDHLFIGTHQDNMIDMVKKGRNRFSPMRGEKNPMAKLTRKAVEEIRARYSSDTPHGKHYRGANSYSLIAKDYGVSSGAIRLIVQGMVWS